MTVPAGGTYSALRLTGTVRLTARNRRAGVAACMVDLRSVELTGHAGARAGVPLPEYRAAAPDPQWREAPGVLRHLEHGRPDVPLPVRAAPTLTRRRELGRLSPSPSPPLAAP